MNRIEQRFNELRQQNRAAMIPFITAGDPHPQYTVELMNALVAGGADLIELGMPFSDPMADGPVIQRASERALANQVSLHDVLDMVRSFREGNPDTPVVLMGYLNPIEAMGYQQFAQQATQAGVDGVLLVDIPPEEGDELLQILKSNGLLQIYLLAPTSTPERIERICAMAGGFVYYVSVKGITGANTLDTDAVRPKIDLIRSKTDLPVGVGFGIKNPESAAAVADFADAVVVGSALVSEIEQRADQPEAIAPVLTDIISGMRQAMDQVRAH